MIGKVPSSIMTTSRVMAARRVLYHPTVRRATVAAAAQQQSNKSWSGSLSHATPEADFTSLHVSANPATMEAEWSQELSFAAPESDFSAQRSPQNDSTNYDELKLQVSANSATVESEWAQEILLKNAKDDVAQLQAVLEKKSDTELNLIAVDRMMHQLQWSSPESAIGYTHIAETMDTATQQQFEAILQDQGLPKTLPQERSEPLDLTEVNRMMEQLHFLSPESALGVAHVGETLNADEKFDLRNLFTSQNQQVPTGLPVDVPHEEKQEAATDLLLQEMMRSSPESATGYASVAEILSPQDQAVLHTLQQRHQPLPASIQEALADQHRAIVITEATSPFRVVQVNQAWEGLCGYSQEEAAHQPIGDLLKGQETEPDATRAMVERVLEQPPPVAAPYELDVVNYTKEGRKFLNHLQLGAIYNDNNSGEEQQQQNIQYLVAVLEELNHDASGMRMAA